MTSKKIISALFVMMFIIAPFFVSTSYATGMGNGPPLPCGGVFPPCPIPLDGGISLLLIAGAVYGSKRVFDSTKKNPA